MSTQKLKLADVLSAVSALDEILKSKLPALAAYRLSLLKSKLQPMADSFNSIKEEAVKRHGTLIDETEGKYQVTPESMPLLAGELNSLLAAEDDIEVGDKLSISSLGSVEVTGSSLAALMWYLTE